MDVKLVLEAFMLLSGLSKQEAEPWLPLCHWAAASLYGRLAIGVDVAANQNLLSYAAGAMTYYKYVLRNASKQGTTSFSAGDVKVTEDIHHTAAVAKELYEDAIRSVEHLFADDEFEFMGVVFE